MKLVQKRTERRSERYHFKLHFKHKMIPIDTYAALVSISRPGRGHEYHILQIWISTRKVATKKKNGAPVVPFHFVFCLSLSGESEKTFHLTTPYDKNVDDDDKAMHRRIALHGGAGDRAISQPRRRRTLRPHRDRTKGGDRARDSAHGIYSRTHPRHRKNTHPRHQDGRVFVKNTPLQLRSCARGVARATTSAGGARFVFN